MSGAGKEYREIRITNDFGTPPCPHVDESVYLPLESPKLCRDVWGLRQKWVAKVPKTVAIQGISDLPPCPHY